MTQKTPPPLEHEECIALKHYLDILVEQGRVTKYAHLVNELKLDRKGGQRPNFAYLNSRKAEGWQPGVPDYLIVFPNSLLFVEMKKQKGGTISKAQKAWLEAINAAGVKAVVCRGFEQAKEAIDRQVAA